MQATGSRLHTDCRAPLGEVDEQAGERRLLGRGLAQGPVGHALAGGFGGDGVGQQGVEVFTAHRADGSVLPVPDTCLFCRIVNGELPSQEVLATERTYAFRDLNPSAPTHVLVIPREHIENADTVRAEDADVLVEMVLAAQRIARAEGIEEGGYRLVFNVGEDTGNSVPHLHLHVLGGRQMGWPPG